MLRNGRRALHLLHQTGRSAGSQFQTVRESSSRKQKIEVILKEDVAHLGSKGSITSVRPGFFRNYLYPKKLAVYATHENLSKLEKSELDAAREKDERRRQAAVQQTQLLTILNRLTSKPVEVSERTIEGTAALYGSVSPRLICDAVGKQLNISLPESRIMLAEPIRTTGLHRIPLNLSTDHATHDTTYMSVIVKAAITTTDRGGSAAYETSSSADAQEPNPRTNPDEDHWID